MCSDRRSRIVNNSVNQEVGPDPVLPHGLRVLLRFRSSAVNSAIHLGPSLATILSKQYRLQSRQRFAEFCHNGVGSVPAAFSKMRARFMCLPSGLAAKRSINHPQSKMKNLGSVVIISSQGQNRKVKQDYGLFLVGT